jgi:hypothetical protein
MRFNQIRVDLKFLRLAPHMVLWKYAALHLAEVHFRSETMSNKQPSTSYSKFNVVSRWVCVSPRTPQAKSIHPLTKTSRFPRRRV